MAKPAAKKVTEVDALLVIGKAVNRLAAALEDLKPLALPEPKESSAEQGEEHDGGEGQ
jgi:hypothetical protein